MLGHESQQKAVEKIIKDFDGNMALIILKIEKLLNRYFMSNSITGATSLEFDIAFDTILKESGYYALVNNMVDKDYNILFGMVKDGFKKGGFAIEYTANDLKKVMALKALQENKFAVFGSTAGTALKENLYRYSLSDYSVEDMASQIATDFKGTNLARHSTTLARTTAAEFQQSIIDIESEGLDGVYLYVGVLDGVTRDFCSCVLRQKAYYNKDEKNKIQSDPKRKYNCRHRLRFVTEDYAKKQGYTKSTGLSC